MRHVERLQRIVPAIAMACALALVQFLLQGHLGLALQDEGFLWYGVDALKRGELPLRDFRSYDPGRYFWCAAWSTVFGDGIVAVRAAGAMFQALGLTCGLLAARRVVSSRTGLAATGVLLSLWMFPTWKLYEPGLTMMLVLAGVRMLEAPSISRHFVAGVFVGLAAFFGRNHGLYGALALLGLAPYAWARIDRTRLAMKLAALGAGIVVGYTPMLLLMLFADGFASAWLASVLFYVRQSAANAPHAATWPWTVDWSTLTALEGAARIATSLFFLLLAAGNIVLVFAAFGRRESTAGPRSLAVAALCVGIPYLHHVAVRSDVHHLAQMVHPLLLGTLALPAALSSAPTGSQARRATGAVLAALLAASLLAIGPEQPLGRELAQRGTPRAFVELEACTDRLRVDPAVAQRANASRARIEASVPSDEPLLLSPKLLALYPMLGRRSPTWDVYPAWRSGPREEQRMLDELSSLSWALVEDTPLGGADGMRFSTAYPRVWRVLELDFERISTPELPPSFLFLRRKQLGH